MQPLATTAKVVGFCVINSGVYQRVQLVMDIEIVEMAPTKNAVGMRIVPAM